jgi:hypothetical protein
MHAGSATPCCQHARTATHFQGMQRPRTGTKCCGDAQPQNTAGTHSAKHCGDAQPQSTGTHLALVAVVGEAQQAGQVQQVRQLLGGYQGPRIHHALNHLCTHHPPGGAVIWGVERCRSPHM